MLEDGHSFFTAKRGLLDQRVTIQVAKLPSGNFSVKSNVFSLGMATRSKL